MGMTSRFWMKRIKRLQCVSNMRESVSSGSGIDRLGRCDDVIILARDPFSRAFRSRGYREDPMDLYCRHTLGLRGKRSSIFSI